MHSDNPDLLAYQEVFPKKAYKSGECTVKDTIMLITLPKRRGTMGNAKDVQDR